MADKSKPVEKLVTAENKDAWDELLKEHVSSNVDKPKSMLISFQDTTGWHYVYTRIESSEGRAPRRRYRIAVPTSSQKVMPTKVTITDDNDAQKPVITLWTEFGREAKTGLL